MQENKDLFNENYKALKIDIEERSPMIVDW
jgi:hypothetical protein